MRFGKKRLRCWAVRSLGARHRPMGQWASSQPIPSTCAAAKAGQPYRKYQWRVLCRKKNTPMVPPTAPPRRAAPNRVFSGTRHPPRLTYALSRPISAKAARLIKKYKVRTKLIPFRMFSEYYARKRARITKRARPARRLASELQIVLRRIGAPYIPHGSGGRTRTSTFLAIRPDARPIKLRQHVSQWVAGPARGSRPSSVECYFSLAGYTATRERTKESVTNSNNSFGGKEGPPWCR